MTHTSTTSVAFAGLGLSTTTLAAVDDLGYTEPTPVQAAAIPEVLAGRDLLAAAQTGTGKTAAFLLPTMDRLSHARHGRGPLMLVVTPTRELANQIEDVADAIAARTKHRCTTVVGGVGYQPQIDALRRGTDLLVATPGRLVDLIDQGACDLGDVEVLVLDEADRMLDMGFMPQMRKIVAQIPADRQTLLLSATLDDSVLADVHNLVHDPARVEIARKGVTADTIDQYVLPVSLEAKNALLAKVLKQAGPEHVIVFTRTKHRADTACKRLRRAGISCAPIHGNRSQKQREHALADFRERKTDVLVATDVLARGIDISDVRYVVNFDVPEDPEDYIHRIGRTGRAGEAGWALTFVTENDFEDFRRCESLMNRLVPTYGWDNTGDLGEEPPVLDPDRVARPAKGIRRTKRTAAVKQQQAARKKELTERAAAKRAQGQAAKTKAKAEPVTEHAPAEPTPKGSTADTKPASPTSTATTASTSPKAKRKKRRRMTPKVTPKSEPLTKAERKPDDPRKAKKGKSKDKKPKRADNKHAVNRHRDPDAPRGFVSEATAAKRRKGSRHPGDLGGRR